jgi:menaquinone-dependent protoporphyrinogen oxidase
MTKILIAYTTNAGSTEDVAQAVAEEVAKTGCPVDVRRLEEVSDLEAYAMVIVGAPMILGWHRSAVKFVKRHQAALSRKKVAYFCTAMRLTQTGEEAYAGIPVCVDGGIVKEPQNPGRLGFKEQYATLGNYLRPIVKAAPTVKPVSVGFFGGKLELFRLKWWQALFVMLIIRAQPGEFRDFSLIRGWAGQLRAHL